MGRLKALPHRLAMLRPHRMRQPESPKERDSYRDEQSWRKWYRTARWKKLRWATLLADKFTCQMCGDIYTDTSKLVADHKQPHRGDERLFWDGANLTTLCATCHSSLKQREEQAVW